MAKEAPPTSGWKSEAKVSQSNKGKKLSQSEEKVIQQSAKPYQMMPKKPSSAYVCFAGEFMMKVKASGNFKSAPESMRAAGQNWSTLTDAQKKPYN